MSSPDLPICAFCTFVSPPGSKICEICKKTLHSPVASAPKFSEIKICPNCSTYNEFCDKVCQMCGTGLPDDPVSEPEETASANACSMCGKCLPGEIKVKVCKACIYHNSANTKKCLICKTKFGSKQKTVVSKVCPFCNHDNADEVECSHCTFKNSIRNVHCDMCEKLLPNSTNLEHAADSWDSDIDDMDDPYPTDTDSDSMDEEPMDEAEDEGLDGVKNTAESMDMDEESTANTTIGNVSASAVASTSTVDDKAPEFKVSADSFEMLETAPQSHHYFHLKQQANTSKFLRAVNSNIEILKTSLPPGVWIKAYEDRMDLLTFMIEGPNETPYENGLFVFDIHLPRTFPSKPPKAHYISFWHARLNPNLYVDGKVCVSLLGTWMAERKEEKWGPKSTLLQLIVSIQGLILVEQPYFNEPGLAGLMGTTLGNQGSTGYNDRVVIGMINSTTALINNPPVAFRKEILMHFSKCGRKMYERFMKAGEKKNGPSANTLESFRLTIENLLNRNEN